MAMKKIRGAHLYLTRETRRIEMTWLEREHERETRTRNINMITRNNTKVEEFPLKKFHVVRRHRLHERSFGAAFGTRKITIFRWTRNVLKANAYRICHESGAHAFLWLCVCNSDGKEVG